MDPIWAYQGRAEPLQEEQRGPRECISRSRRWSWLQEVSISSSCSEHGQLQDEQKVHRCLWMVESGLPRSDPSHVLSQQLATLDLLCLLDAQELSDHSPQLSRLFVILWSCAGSHLAKILSHIVKNRRRPGRCLNTHNSRMLLPSTVHSSGRTRDWQKY